MKSYKKIFSLVLVFSLVLSAALFFNGCGKSAKDEFETAQGNMNKAKDVTIKDGKLTAAIDANGQKVEVTGKLDAQVIKSTTDDPRDLQGKLSFSISLPGASNKATLYIKDRMVYSDNGKLKKKEKITGSKADFEKIVNMSNDIKISEFVKKDEKDGDKVKLTLDGKKYLKSVMEKAADASKTSNAEMKKQLEIANKQLEQLGIDDINLEATIKNDKFTSLKYNIPMEIDGTLMRLPSGKVKIDVTVELGNIAVDSGEKINFPDFKSFK